MIEKMGRIPQSLLQIQDNIKNAAKFNDCGTHQI